MGERGGLTRLFRSEPLLLFLVFAVNAATVWRLFFIQYLDQIASVEGEFIAMAAYIQRHWPGYDWQSMWYGGFPVVRTYQPLVHYTVASLASVAGISAASAFHIVGAVSYSLGGVAFYCLAKALSGNRAVALGGALCFSLFSPSGLVSSGIRTDMGGVWNARRLQALIVYGELPNLTGIMLGMFALALLHRALSRRTAASALQAAILMAAVPATNWPSTVALSLGIACYVVAMSTSDLRRSLPRLGLIGAMTVAFALPFALPSSILATFGNANAMVDIPKTGPSLWATAPRLLALLLVCFTLARFVLAKFGASFGERFAALWALVLTWVVLSVSVAGIAILPLPLRFHIAMEVPLTLVAAFLIRRFSAWAPQNGRLVLVVLSVFVLLQVYHYRRYARAVIHKLDITRTIEYEEARWFDANMHGERVLTPGSIEFWTNAFTATPQMTGCCEQSLVNRQNYIAHYITSAGYESDAESADFSTLWMKAYAVHAVSIGGKKSREWYKQSPFSGRFKDRLPLLWSSGDDYIYQVPARVPGLARVVRPGDLVRHPPGNGIDAAELRAFVGALDDASLPAAGWAWRDVNSASIRAVMTPDQVIAVALNYHRGWHATVAGKPVPVKPDGLGFLAIEPHCLGACVVELRWSPGVEPWIVVPVALLTLAGALGWCFYNRQGKFTFAQG